MVPDTDNDTSSSSDNAMDNARARGRGARGGRGGGRGRGVSGVLTTHGLNFGSDTDGEPTPKKSKRGRGAARETVSGAQGGRGRVKEQE